MESISLIAEYPMKQIQDDTLLPLDTFLEKEENYKMFREYLSYCWALENLLFMENVYILKDLILRCNKNETETLDTVQNNNEQDNEEDGSYDGVKEKIFEIQQKVYREYIPHGAPN